MFRAYPRHAVTLSLSCFKDVLVALKDGRMIKGEDIQAFEEEFARYIGMRYALGVSSARFAFYLLIKAFGFNKDDEIIMSAYNYYIIPVITELCGLRPVFVDVNPYTYNINPDLIEKKITAKTRAILVTHLFGQPCDMEAILDLVHKHNLKLIEDCAHVCGAEYKNKKAGTFAVASFFSFGAGKNLSAFGGGMITTNSETLYKNIKNLLRTYPYPSKTSIWSAVFINFAMYLLTHRIVFSLLTYPIFRLLALINFDLIDDIFEKNWHLKSKISPNYQTKMANFQAKIGRKELRKIDRINSILIRNGKIYTGKLNSLKNIQCPLLDPNVKHIYVYYHIKISQRKLFRKRLLQKGIDTKREPFSNCAPQQERDNYPISEELSSELVEIPNNIHLSTRDINYIAEQINMIVTEFE